MKSNGELPSEKNERAFNIVKGAVEGKLADYYAWPKKIFEFELEDAGIYRDFTGRSLQELSEEQEIIDQEKYDGRNYFVRAGESGSLDQIVKESVEGYYQLLDEIGKFGELLAFTSLCKIHRDLNGLTREVLPEGNRSHRLRGIELKPDAFVEFQRKCSPVEVYNGTQYIKESHKKIAQQVIPSSSQQHPHSCPIMITRLASDDAEERVLEHNGVIIQTGKVIVNEQKESRYSRFLDLLDISRNFQFVPPLETIDGYEIDGQRYSEWVNDGSEYSKIAPHKIACANIPNFYEERVRGGIQLIHVNSLYRESTTRIQKYACLVLQPLFHHLLRQEEAELEQLLEFGWEDFEDRYPRTKANSVEDAILDQVRNYLSELEQNNIVNSYSDTYETVKSSHPHLSMSIDSPRGDNLSYGLG